MCFRCVGENPTLQNKSRLTNHLTFNKNFSVAVQKPTAIATLEKIPSASYLYFSPKTRDSWRITKYCSKSSLTKEVALPEKGGCASFYQ